LDSASMASGWLASMKASASFTLASPSIFSNWDLV